MFMDLIPYNHSTQSTLHLLLRHLYNLSQIHTYVMHKSEKALGRNARKSCVVCWEKRLFLLKDGNVTAKWLGMTDTVETGRRPEEQFKANFWMHLPAPAVCLLLRETSSSDWSHCSKACPQQPFCLLQSSPPCVTEQEHLQPRPCPTEALTAHSPAGILSAGACMMLTRVGISLICIGPWQASIWASSLKISWAREATTGSGERKHCLLKHTHTSQSLPPLFWLGKAASFPSTTGISVHPMTTDKVFSSRIQQQNQVCFGMQVGCIPLLYLRNIAMVKGQILFSMLAVNAASTVHTMHSVSITRFSTSELNWVARWIRPSRMLGRKGCNTWVLSEIFSWSQ